MGTDKWTGEQRWVATLVIAVLLVIIANLGLPLGPIQVVAGIITTFFAPGYALLFVIRPPQITAISRLVLSIPLSIALAIGCGVFLNLSPFGVYPHTLAITTGLVTLGLFLIAAYPKRQALRQTLAPNRWRRQPGQRSTRLSKPGWPAVLGAVVLIAIMVWAGVGLAYGSREQPAYYTEFFLIAAKPDGVGAATVQLGIRNKEGSTHRYLIRATRGPNPDDPEAGPPTPPPGETNVLEVEREILIEENTESDLTLRLNLACGDVIEAQLWRIDNGVTNAPYRTVRVRPDCAATGSERSQVRKFAAWSAQVIVSTVRRAS